MFGGGEKNNPPIYGKVFISAKPSDGYILTSTKKQAIKNTVDALNVLSIEPEMIDPTFVFMNPSIKVYYDPFATTLSAQEIQSKLITAITDYETNQLSSFEKDFRYSKFVKMLDDTDDSIQSNFTEIRLEKRFVPIYDSAITYSLKFNTILHNPFSGYQGNLVTGGFYLNNLTTSLCYLDDDGRGNIRLYYLNGQSRVYVKNDIGTIDYTTGDVTIGPLDIKELPVGEEELRIRVMPDEYDYFPQRNQILLLAYPTLQLIRDDTKDLITSVVVETFGNRTPFEVNSVLTSVTI